MRAFLKYRKSNLMICLKNWGAYKKYFILNVVLINDFYLISNKDEILGFCLQIRKKDNIWENAVNSQTDRQSVIFTGAMKEEDGRVERWGKEVNLGKEDEIDNIPSQREK